MNRTALITIVIVALVGALAFFQKPTGDKLIDLASNKSKTTPASNTVDEHGHGAKGKVALPKPMGTKTAPIKVRVFITSDNTCDTSTLTAMEQVHKKYAGKVYIEFADLLDEKVKKEADKLKIGCKSGLTINGKNRFFLPGRGLKGTIMFDGPVGQKNYKGEDIEAVVQFLLEHPEKPKASSSKSS